MQLITHTIYFLLLKPAELPFFESFKEWPVRARMYGAYEFNPRHYPKEFFGSPAIPQDQQNIILRINKRIS